MRRRDFIVRFAVIGPDGKLKSFLEMAGESQKFHKPGWWLKFFFTNLVKKKL